MKKIAFAFVGLIVSCEMAVMVLPGTVSAYQCQGGPKQGEIVENAEECGPAETSSDQKDARTNVTVYGLKGTGNGNLVDTGSKKYCNVGKLIETTLFGDICDINGSAMFYFINLVLQVLSYGVGIGGVLGIVLSGIQYLTARDNEAQAAKARRRIFEVVIGLIVYAVMYVVLNFLLIPGGIN